MAGLLAPKTYLVSRYLGTGLIIKVLLEFDPDRLLSKPCLLHEYDSKTFS